MGEAVDKRPRVLTDDEDEEIKRLRSLIATRQESAESSSSCDSFLSKEFQKDFLEVVPRVEGIAYRKQDKLNNCGQTALRMVGVGEEIIAQIGEENDRKLNTFDMFALSDKGHFGFRNDEALLAADQTPQVVLYSYPGRQNHWVVRAAGFIFDPARGAMEAQKYQRLFSPKVLAIFDRIRLEEEQIPLRKAA